MESTRSELTTYLSLVDYLVYITYQSALTAANKLCTYVRTYVRGDDGFKTKREIIEETKSEREFSSNPFFRLSSSSSSFRASTG